MQIEVCSEGEVEAEQTEYINLAKLKQSQSKLAGTNIGLLD